MGMAFASTLAPKDPLTTVELKINFFRPVWGGSPQGRGKSCAAAGRAWAYVECEYDERAGSLPSSVDCLVLRGEDAKGAKPKSCRTRESKP